MGICNDGRSRKLKKNNFNEDIYNSNNINPINNKNIKDKIDVNDIHNIKPEKVDFPHGEHYYQLIEESNRSELIKKEEYLGEKVELFFSLTHIKNPNDEHSFEISIINLNVFHYIINFLIYSIRFFF
jgi:hypothetical protein